MTDAPGNPAVNLGAIDALAAAWGNQGGSTTYPANHNHVDASPCVLSPVFSFVVNPLLIFATVCLYSVAIERIAGIRYTTSPKALGPWGERLIYYAGFFFVIFFSSTTLFVRHHGFHFLTIVRQRFTIQTSFQTIIYTFFDTFDGAGARSKFRIR